MNWFFRNYPRPEKSVVVTQKIILDAWTKAMIESGRLYYHENFLMEALSLELRPFLKNLGLLNAREDDKE